MIVQTAVEGGAHLVIKQSDHGRMSGQLALAFGNDLFAGLEPRGAVAFVVAHHDEGWAETDTAVLRDPNTNLPYHLTQTPLTELVKTSARSPEFNENHHAYSGILSSMHTYGLFNGRYGLSDKIFIDLVPVEHKEAVQGMLDAELARQERLKLKLREGAETAPSASSGQAVWASDDHLFHNYKLLQFFDTLALYFHMVHREARSRATFLNVPMGVGNDTTVTIDPVGEGVYRLDPYPFKEEQMSFSYSGRPMLPQAEDVDLKAYFEGIDLVEEQVMIVR